MTKDRHVLGDPAWAQGAALVVGGSGGIGRAICGLLAEAGADVALTYRGNAAAAEAAAEDVRTAGQQAAVAQLDLQDPAAVKQVVGQVVARFGSLHSVVYASGPVVHMTPIHRLTPEQWGNVIDTDVKGFFNLVWATLPLFREQRSGAYAAVITTAVERVPPLDIMSASPKASIEMLVKGIAVEEGKNGIRANCIGPGWIDAGLGREVLRNELRPEQVERVKKLIPLRRVGEAREVADAVLFLLSARARYVTGQTLSVDGGGQL
ncbi:MAG: SDR family NAD(P)-dependent oxidoreductase [Minwuia sp.]|nr:SDR family NAD(P)-dependent oxidoreductase [Minwuia sp.]